jgi:hypothetical protein
MNRRHFYACLVALSAACSTRLTSQDAKAVQLQVDTCADISLRLADAGAGLPPSLVPARIEAKSCLCGARGIAKRAGVDVPDAAMGCPQ